MLFLDLPQELVLESAAYLSERDLNALVATGNRKLRDILLGSVLLRYHVLLERTGLEENPAAMSGVVASDRLEALMERERRWLTFQPLGRHTIELDFESAGIYDLTGEYFLVGDVPNDNSMCTAIRYISTISPSAEWRRIDVGVPVIDFGMAVEEHDLIAVLTCRSSDINSLQMRMSVKLICFSTGNPHPLAKNAEILLQEVPMTHGRPSASIEVVGKTLAISFLYWTERDRDSDQLYLVDWQNGDIIAPPLQIYCSGLIFLTPEVLLIPNLVDASIDVACIPSSASDPDTPVVIHTLRLPELAAGHSIFTFQCRGEPNPRSSTHKSAYSTLTPFLPSPTDNLILFTLLTGSPITGTTTDHMFVIPRLQFAAALLPLLGQYPDGVDIDYASWGPYHVRWLDAQDLSKHYITTTCGLRLVAIPHDAETHPAEAKVLCFSPHAVALEDSDGDGDGSLGLGTLVKPDKPGAEPAFASLKAVWKEHVYSRVPYREVYSAEKFAYDTVIVNNESIIGVKFGGNNVASLEVLHFG
uniref:F-box domain-containing protein n=1 Tax=Mycena chlorophos TaxID=658473 RepID=A0ABQ0LN78_MYCCL|nr:predicted protein [Mycena chlorophos]